MSSLPAALQVPASKVGVLSQLCMQPVGRVRHKHLCQWKDFSSDQIRSVEVFQRTKVNFVQYFFKKCTCNNDFVCLNLSHWIDYLWVSQLMLTLVH